MKISEAPTGENLKCELENLGRTARSAARRLAQLAPDEKVQILNAMADALSAHADAILKANAADMLAAQDAGLSGAMLDRLKLDETRLAAMAKGLRDVAAQQDPVGVTLAEFTPRSGIHVRKVTVPLGVIGIIFEARPNVTADAAGICLKAGNAVILRGGKEAIRSNLAIAEALQSAAGLPAGAIQLIPWTAHEVVPELLKLDRYIDVVIPRGGERLIRTVVAAATMPVIKHYKGVCHLYCDASCDAAMAKKILLNGKCQRPGVCNALETLLVDKSAAAQLVPELFAALKGAGVTVYADEEFRKFAPEAEVLPEDNLYNEYLDLKISAKVVDGVEEAISHVNEYGSHHSDAIVSRDAAAIERFLNEVDSAVVYSNASTRFTDGGEFGMGAEIGISTDKLHARGPMGVNELVSYKFVVHGAGEVR